jgi:hypothetical protein
MKLALFSVLFVLPAAAAEIFGGAQIAELYRIRLDRGDLLLESIQNVVRTYGIGDGAVLTAAGSLQECTFHRVKSVAEKPEDEFLTGRTDGDPQYQWNDCRWRASSPSDSVGSEGAYGGTSRTVAASSTAPG